MSKPVPPTMGDAVNKKNVCLNCRKSKIGICRYHLQGVLSGSKDMFLLCNDCPISVCDFRGMYGKGGGVCVYELLDKLDWDNKERVNSMFHRTLEMERRFVMRQARKAHHSGMGVDLELFDRLIGDFYRHVGLYGRFKGWYSKSHNEEEGLVEKKEKEKEEALSIMRKIFGEQKNIKSEKIGDGKTEQKDEKDGDVFAD